MSTLPCPGRCGHLSPLWAGTQAVPDTICLRPHFYGVKMVKDKEKEEYRIESFVPDEDLFDVVCIKRFDCYNDDPDSEDPDMLRGMICDALNIYKCVKTTYRGRRLFRIQMLDKEGRFSSQKNNGFVNYGIYSKIFNRHFKVIKPLKTKEKT
jgi:hypothetical protein